ncbi:MAG: 3-oxoacid CoA-transferase subunit A [Negativicutes bacterium]|nr:3-oxoacid CoA-transferase subunit A [Negativicutes bacterium]
MKNKLIDLNTAMQLFRDGMTVMIGGFLGNGTSEQLVDALIATNVKDYTVIANDTAMPGIGIAKLIATKRVRKLIVSHIGMNPETGRQMSTGELEVELVPQGTLAERIRCGGSGLGGVLTATGLGTEIEQGKQIISVNGKDYLLELPLHGDIALIHATVIDQAGNCFYEGTTKNFNHLMAMACDVVIATAETTVEVGELDCNYIMTSGIFVDYILKGVA